MWKRIWNWLLGEPEAAPENSSPATDSFDFSENLTASSKGPSLGSRSPQPGTVVIEVRGEDGEPIALDTFRTQKRPTRERLGRPSTLVIVPIGDEDRSHREVEYETVASVPLDLPDHLRKPGAKSVYLWWSTEDGE